MMRACIESMAHGGFGVARIDGFVHFVPESVTGDVVELELVSRRKTYGFARLIRVLEPSAMRTEPFCPFFGECGGCQLQHIDYEKQLVIKESLFLEQMRRIGGIETVPLNPGIGSKRKRARMRFQIRQGRIGLFKRRTHDLCLMDSCPVALPEVNAVFHQVREALQGIPGPCDGTVTILASDSGALIATDLPRGTAKKLYDRLEGEVLGCVIQHPGRRVVLGEPYLSFDVQGIPVFVGPDNFWQADGAVNELLVREICAFLDGASAVFDLYCGCGNMTLPLSRVCARVTGVEKSGHAIDAARFSAFQSGITNVSFIVGDVVKNFKGPADGVLLDPPRSGIPAALIRKIGTVGPERMAYVSCNPATLARDVGRFAEGGYRLRSVRVLDMFPHTHHIESLSLLEPVEE